MAVVALVDDTLPIADIRNEPSPAENEVSSSPAANSSLAHPSIFNIVARRNAMTLEREHPVLSDLNDNVDDEI